MTEMACLEKWFSADWCLRPNHHYITDSDTSGQSETSSSKPILKSVNPVVEASVLHQIKNSSPKKFSDGCDKRSKMSSKTSPKKLRVSHLIKEKQISLFENHNMSAYTKTNLKTKSVFKQLRQCSYDINVDFNIRSKNKDKIKKENSDSTLRSISLDPSGKNSGGIKKLDQYLLLRRFQERHQNKRYNCIVNLQNTPKGSRKDGSTKSSSVLTTQHIIPRAKLKKKLPKTKVS